VLNVPRKPRHKSAAKTAYSVKCPIFRAAARLSGQREDVLVQALRDFKSGKRVGSGVASMADVTYEMTDSDMEAVSHYLALRR